MRRHIVIRTFVSAAIVAGLGLSFPVVANADIISDLYGATYDRTEVYVGEDGSDGTEVAQLDEGESNDIALYSADSLTPRSCSQEMLYFCAWESGQNYDQGLSWGDGYHAMGYFQFDNRYDLGTFLHAVYNYNPDTYSALKVIGDYYGWNVYGKDIRNSEGDVVEEGNITKVASPSGNGTIADDLNKAWHACYAANPAEFSQLQNGWAYDHYYVPAANYMRSRGLSIDDRSDSVKSLCWGMSNLFGTGGWRKFVGGWTSGYDWNGNWNDWAEWPGANLSSNMNDAEFVEALCDYVVDNVSVFYKAQPQYWDGWRNRYRGEKAHYLNALSTDGIVPVRNGEYQINGKWYYYVDGAMATGFTGLPDGRTVYYGDDGAMRYGEQYVGGYWYHLDEHDGNMSTGLTRLPDGRTVLYSGEGRLLYGVQDVAGSKRYFDIHDANMARSRTFESGSETYYADADGSFASGERRIGGRWYYFDPAKGGAMATGFTGLPDGRTVYYGDDGAMRYGEQYVGGYWYHLDEHDGNMSTGLTRLPDGRTVLYSGEGRLLYGVQDVAGSKRYFDIHDANMARNKWVSIDGSDWLYYAQADGALSARAHHLGSGGYVFSDEEGNPLTGWQRFNETAFYCDASGLAKTGEQHIDGYWYHFDESTAAMSIGITDLPDGRRVYYSLSGKMQYGEQRINGSWYYFRDDDGSMVYGWKFLSKGSRWVWYGPAGGSGKMRYGWQDVDGIKRYFDENDGSCDKIGYQTPQRVS